MLAGQVQINVEFLNDTRCLNTLGELLCCHCLAAKLKVIDDLLQLSHLSSNGLYEVCVGREDDTLRRPKNQQWVSEISVKFH